MATAFSLAPWEGGVTSRRMLDWMTDLTGNSVGNLRYVPGTWFQGLIEVKSGTRRLVLPECVRAAAPQGLKPGRWVTLRAPLFTNAPRDFASINPLVIDPPAWFIPSPRK